MDYDLEIQRVITEIKKAKAKKVLLQFPDGLKPFAISVADELKKKTKAEMFIYAGSCYGACDLPTHLKGFDLLVSFGHAPFKR